jgi:hypothetical protein
LKLFFVVVGPAVGYTASVEAMPGKFGRVWLDAVQGDAV